MRISEKLKEKRTTPYREIAQKCGVTVLYVGQIARGERVPKRKSGKAMKVLEELNKMCNEPGKGL
jgi:transcriptional regulator with XRE-family HTH domain